MEGIKVLFKDLQTQHQHLEEVQTLGEKCEICWTYLVKANIGSLRRLFANLRGPMKLSCFWPRHPPRPPLALVRDDLFRFRLTQTFCCGEREADVLICVYV